MSRGRIIVAALLVLSAVVFAIGVSVERSQSETHVEAPAASQPLGKPTLAPEGSLGREAAEKTAAAPKRAATSAPEGSAEREAAEKKPVATPAGEGSAAREAAESGGSSAESSEAAEKLFGIKTESTALVVAVVVVSLLLAGGLVVIRSPLILVAAAVVVLGATAFDVRELAHQIDESRNGVAALAALTGALHVAVATAAAGVLLVDRRKTGS